jgi:acyl-CoA synthetase (AMP-forming)/AMP-acid ligase II
MYRDKTYTALNSNKPKNLFPVQIENALTAHHEIREAAAVSVADPTYGEVVGAWIVREPHTKMSCEDVRQSVVDRMNPQVSWCDIPSRT